MHIAQEMSDWSDGGLYESILDAVPANVALLNRRGEIIAANDAWIQFAELHEISIGEYGLGVNYSAFCDQQDTSDGALAAKGLRNLLVGEGETFHLEYEMPLAGGVLWARITARRIERADKSLVIITHEDITVQRRAQAALGRATAALLHAEDDERRRIARELHDGTAQYLTGAKLMLAVLMSEPRADKVRERPHVPDQRRARPAGRGLGPVLAEDRRLNRWIDAKYGMHLLFTEAPSRHVARPLVAGAARRSPARASRSRSRY
jgi:two-component system NarL family sensor kinase